MKKSFIARFVFWLVAFTIPSAVVASQCPAPEPFSASYYSEVERFLTLEGKGVQSLKKLSDGKFKFDFNVKSMIADVNESVVFEWDSENCHIIPVRYSQSMTGKLIKDRSTHFTNHRSANKIEGAYKGKDFATDSKDFYVDPLGMQIQVRQDLRDGKNEMEYYMVHKGKVLIDKYRAVGNETIKVGDQSYNAVKVEKVRPDSSDRVTYLWFAPELDYTLLKLVHKEPEKEQYEVVMTSYKKE